MTTPQAGIFAVGTRTHHHLEFDIDQSAGVDALAEAIGTISESGGGNVVIGFGAELWTRVSTVVPADLGNFEEVRGLDGHTAPSTQHDIWIWIHGTGVDQVLDGATACTAALAGLASLAAETRGFEYHDSRDLTGFIDGTENPPPAEAVEVACIPDGEPGAGGSHVIAQRWVHDLAAFNELSVDAQENVIGRTKPDSVAIPTDVRPADAHISRAELLDADGNERPIYRRSVPFGDVTKRGLYFLGFSAERERFDGMLAQIFGTSGDGVRDHLIDFSTPTTGSYYFAPSLEDLAAVSPERRAL